jgi:hypothetical protein
VSQQAWRAARPWMLVLLIPALLATAIRAQDEVKRSLQQSWYSKTEPFSHRWHVPTLWRTLLDEPSDAGNPREDRRLLGETLRDCRGCHKYDAETPRDPQAVCAECHYLPNTIERDFDAGFEKSLGPLRREITAWSHKDHLAIGCKACHEPEGLFIPDRLPVVEGTALCFRCHMDRDPADPKTRDWAPVHKVDGGQELVRNEWLRDPVAPDGGHARFLARLNAHPSMAPEGFTKFRHGDHIAATGRNDQSQCVACHGKVPEADLQTLGEATIGADTLRSCLPCHLAKAPARLEFTLASNERVSPSARTFQHVDHFKSRDPANEKDLPGTCSRCHVYQDSRGSDEYPLVPEFTARTVYDGCVACHYHEHERKHKLPDHGEVAACGPCHALGGGTMKANLPTDAVARVRPVFSLVGLHTHPFLTESRGPREKSCFEPCHRTQADSLPSRVTGRRFDHKSHLPPQPKATDCEPCHARIARTKGPGEILATYDTETPAVAGQLAQPDPKVCGKCHLGSVLVAQTAPDAPAAAAAPRVRFPHDQHLGPRTRATTEIPAMDCITCHVPGAEYRADVGTTKDAATCQPCHRHEEWKTAITGGKDRAYVTTCVQCHEGRDGRGVVPADNAVVMTPTQRVAGVRGVQLHDRSKPCGGCHTATQETRRPEGGPHVRARLRSVHAAEQAAQQSKLANCLGCHWEMNLSGALDFSFVTGTPEFQDFRDRQSKHKLQNPPRRATRSFLGAEMAGYPGKNAVK